LAQLGHLSETIERAIERDESLPRRWLKKDYPQIKALAKEEGADI
jgi:hypothetical protein